MTVTFESEIEEDLTGSLRDPGMLKMLLGDSDRNPRTLEERLIELALRKLPAKPTVRELSPEARAEYMREAKRKSRAAAKERKAAGSLDASADIVRDVLADAAIAILAAGGDQAETVRKALQEAFPKKPGVWLSVEAEARNGKLAPKHVKL